MNKVKKGEISIDDAIKTLLTQLELTSSAGQREALEHARVASFGINGVLAEVMDANKKPQGDDCVSAPDSIISTLILPSSVSTEKSNDKKETLASLEVVCHKPAEFRRIRTTSSINDEIFRDSFDHKKLGVENFISGGSSGCWVMRTHNDNLIIKAVRHTEKDVLLQMIDKYSEYLENHPGSLLTRIVGVFDLKRGNSKPFTVLIMTNAMHNSYISTKNGISLDEVYDLKGSTVGRRSLKVGMDTKENVVDSFSGTMKDLDFRRSITLEKEDRETIVRQLKDDSEFLKDMGLMDYSLLVALHNCTDAEITKYDISMNKIKKWNKSNNDGWSNQLYIGKGLSENTKTIYVFGIIDLLQKWDTVKVAENFAKSKILRHNKHDISAVKPNEYATRFTTLLGGRFETM